MNSLNIIRQELELVKGKNQIELAMLRDKALAAFSKKMKMKTRQKVINSMQSALDASKELTSVSNDEYYHRWVRFDLSKLIDTNDEFQRELLAEYLSENYYIYTDFENDCVTTAEGPCILINHDGDVLDQDSGKWIISKRDYETEEERNALIKAHMEKTGHFPSVIEVDYHGNACYVSTLVAA